jgi:hypothetical protein
MDFREYRRTVREALELLQASCPRLVGACYWAGTSPISIDELEHRVSFDLYFHERLFSWTDQALEDDLRAYEDVNPDDAKRARKLLLEWLREETKEGRG